MPKNTTVIYTRVGGKLRDRFENWRRAQPVIPARSEALRCLLDKALATAASAPPAPAIKNTPG